MPVFVGEVPGLRPLRRFQKTPDPVSKPGEISHVMPLEPLRGRRARPRAIMGGATAREHPLESGVERHRGGSQYAFAINTRWLDGFPE